MTPEKVLYVFTVCGLIPYLHGGLLDRESQRVNSVFHMAQESSTEPVCDAVVDNYRFDCEPDQGTEESCKARGCCWKPVETNDVGRSINVPYCFFPANYPSYKISEYVVVRGGYSVKLTRSEKSGWPGDVMTLQLDVQAETLNRLRIKIFDPAKKRYEVPIEKPEVNSSHPYSMIQAEFTHEPFALSLSAGFQSNPILDSNLVGAPLIFTDQFIQWSFRLNSPHIYGLGEHKEPFLINATTGWQQRAFWARDAAPSFGNNLYGDHRFFMGLTAQGQAYGVFLLNSNAMEMDLQPMPALTMRTTGGILDFYVFFDYTPDLVVQRYLELIGHPIMPPLWSLGYHQCRYGYNSGEELKKVIDRTRAIGIPYEVQWTDIDYMDAHKDWTYDKKNYAQLPDIVKDLHDNDQKYVIIVDPGILVQSGYATYTSGLAAGVFVKNSSGQILIGKVWPGETVFPDFTNPNTSDWWYDQIQTFHNEIPFDGLWLDMNEPSNFVDGSIDGCTNNNLDKPPYTPGVLDNNLASKTICLSAQHYLSSHYNLHSMYGHFEVKATHEALEKLLNKRSFIISRSTFASTGKYGGHWSGDISSTWEDLYYSIPVMLDFQLFGIPLVGADICGFGGDTTEELCTRWMQLGAFYPFMRNHNALSSKDQDPGVWSEAAQKAMKWAVEARYAMLPYLYTLFYEAHVNGSPVARPLAFQYPTDPITWSIDKQFMWGDGLLISPVLEQGATTVQAYFNANDTYFDGPTGKMMTSSGWVTLDAPLDKINIHVRGGTILPYQVPEITTAKQKSNPYKLVVALTNHTHRLTPGHFIPHRGPLISGALFQDDGETNGVEAGAYNYVTFLANNNTLNSTVVHSGYTSATGMKLDEVQVYGIFKVPTEVKVNNQTATFKVTENSVLQITGFEADLLKPLKVKWM